MWVLRSDHITGLVTSQSCGFPSCAGHTAFAGIIGRKGCGACGVTLTPPRKMTEKGLVYIIAVVNVGAPLCDLGQSIDILLELEPNGTGMEK